MSSGIGNFIGSIVGGAVTGGMGPAIGEGIKIALPPAAEAARTLVERLVPDPAAKAAASLALEQAITDRDVAATNAAVEVAKAQASVNLAEAQGNDRFSARWRPAVGWVCTAGFAYQFVVAPVLTWATNIAGVAIGAAIPPAPTLSVSDLMTVLVGILGLGAYRTVERTVGVPGAMPGGTK